MFAAAAAGGSLRRCRCVPERSALARRGRRCGSAVAVGAAVAVGVGAVVAAGAAVGAEVAVGAAVAVGSALEFAIAAGAAAGVEGVVELLAVGAVATNRSQ